MSDIEYVDERIYTVPFGRAWSTPKYKRAQKVVALLRKFVQRHMKPTEINIDPTVNEEIWKNGIGNPPRRIRVRLQKDDQGFVLVTLAEADVEAEE